MSQMLMRFLRRNGRRAQRIVAPVMLLLGLSGFALAQMPYANTLWSQELTLSANVETADYTPTPTPTPLPTATPTNTAVSSSCEPVVTLVSSSFSSGTNTTTYTYNVVRGGSPGSQCQDVSYFAINVCSNPILGAGFVTAETHPGDYVYDPANGGSPKRIKWGNANDNVAPNNLISPFNISFSVTVVGNVAPVNTIWELHAGSNSTRSGTIQGPGPSSCGNLVGSSAPLTANGISPNACLPLVLTTETVKEKDGRTSYSYRLSGGSAMGKAGCPDIETVMLPVCFNPYLEPRGWLADAPAVRDWRYTGQMEDVTAKPAIPRAVSWERSGGRGPWNVILAFEAPGTKAPTEKVHAIGRDASGNDYDLGEVTVPKPAACDALPPAPTATVPASTATATATTPAATPTPRPSDKPGDVSATATPEPSGTPTPTPRPRNTPTPNGAQPTATPPNGGAVWWD